MDTVRVPDAGTPRLVSGFYGEYRFLSNFYEGGPGSVAPSVEHHYQAAKTLDATAAAELLAASTPGRCKRLGMKVALRPDWDEVKGNVMGELVGQKLTDPTLHHKLAATGTALLIETNNWHDQHWGDCVCPQHQATPGHNHLGRILMAQRDTHLPPDTWPRVALTGHRPQQINQDNRGWVRNTLMEIADACRRNHGTTTLISGMALGSDLWWAEAAHITFMPLWAYVPFRGHHTGWDTTAQDTYREMLDYSEHVVTVGHGAYTPAHYHARNDYMVRDANAMVVVLDPTIESKGTASTARKARDAGLPVVWVDPSARRVTFLPPVVGST